MEVINDLARGFANALLPQHLLFCLAGVLIGQIVGILPGLGPSASLAMILPLTFSLEPTSAMIMLAGVYYGAKYGGAITSILINTPGEASSVMTALDGYAMTKKGLGGPALGLAAVSSFIGGTASVVGLTLLSPALASFALQFGPPEYAALIFMGLSMVALLGGKSVIKALLAGLFGLLLGTVGTDPVLGKDRFTFNVPELFDGIEFVLVSMGLFAVGEILVLLQSMSGESPALARVSGRVWPRASDVLACRWTFVRSTAIGFFVGALPGAGGVIASFLSYGTEKRLSQTPDAFGAGAPQGVAAPETADNASTGGAMVPLLTLGVPGSGATAMMLGAMIIYGLRPGPLIFQENSDFVWGLIASMYVGNILLLILNLPLIPLFAAMVRIPYSYLYPAIFALVVIGAYSIRFNMVDVWVMLLFGIIGYLMKRADVPAAPVVLALVLGPLFERSVSQSLTLAHGNPAIFFSRPVSAALLSITLIAYLAPMLGLLQRRPGLGGNRSTENNSSGG